MRKKTKTDKWVNCPECHAKLKKKNLTEHMTHIHNKKTDEIKTKPSETLYKKRQENKNHKVISKLIIGVIAIIFIILVASIFIYSQFNLNSSNIPVNKKNFIVSKEGNGDFSTIQAAIDSALDNDTIFVSKGVYFENINIKKSIKLIGEDKNITIINGNGSGIVVNISVDNVRVSGFTIMNGGTVSGLEPDAGIKIESSYNVIRNCNISSNKRYGLYLYANPNCVNNTIKFNTFFNNKYGIYTYDAKTSNISLNNFIENSDYGIYFGASNNNLISENVFTNNNYAIRIKSSDNNKLINNLILNNNYGIYFCCGANDNIAYYNVLINNTNWNARDDPINIWDNGSVGNYWDDYTGLDEDGDGIGDTAFLINGGKGDRYPLMQPNNII